MRKGQNQSKVASRPVCVCDWINNWIHTRNIKRRPINRSGAGRESISSELVRAHQFHHCVSNALTIISHIRGQRCITAQQIYLILIYCAGRRGAVCMYVTWCLRTARRRKIKNRTTQAFTLFMPRANGWPLFSARTIDCQVQKLGLPSCFPSNYKRRDWKTSMAKIASAHRERRAAMQMKNNFDDANGASRFN